ncbi:dihydrofolate reductase family protein [Nocardia ninae]|uniref:DNA-binding protein n=1 Tax=Nocardia ninae NBRC 108245 TaxID=1210091 RepID=A0A511MQH0_9NOCA|nr:dihydrofolate reductase family protein [Nocardia ninae]GEM42246.1 DNA-binding protein [Nocardia ninae NBRC 108245]
MTKLYVRNLAISLDGYVAGPNQSADNPLGEGGMGLHEWVFATQTGRTWFGNEGGETGVDDDFVKAGEVGIGATIMGRNMFGPIRGAWPDEEWKGWWGDNPPYHHDTFVMTHHPRPSLPMAGGTTFHFVNDTPEEVLKQAVKAADGKDVRLGGGSSVVRQFLQAGLVDELHLAVVPILLGGGERLYDDLGTLPGYRVSSVVRSPAVTHVQFRKA